MEIYGKCYCGAIKFKAKIDPSKVVACHCKDCQVFSGAPFRVSVISKGELFKVEGTPREFLKVSEAGNKKVQGFCEECGTNLYSSDINQSSYNIRVGCLVNAEVFSPVVHIFTDSSVDWLTDLESQTWMSKGPSSDPVLIKKK